MIRTLEARGFTRTEIARRTGLARSTVTMLATGERGQRPSFATVEALRGVAAGLGINTAIYSVAPPDAIDDDPAPLNWVAPRSD